MKHSEYYEVDVLRFFDGHPQERELYEALFRLMEAEFPEASVKVQKSQISFYDRHLFAAVSPALRRTRNCWAGCGKPGPLQKTKGEDGAQRRTPTKTSSPSPPPP